jgi:hypothetical protein
MLTGGRHVGWADSRRYADVDYASAIALSAAALNALGGRAIPRFATRFLSLLHFRQGRWVPNPRHLEASLPHPLWAFLRELFGHIDETGRHLHISDGGHEENLGLATLVERGCQTVIVLDAAADPAYRFGDFEFCCRRLRWKPVEGLSRTRPTSALDGQTRHRVSEEVVFAFDKSYGGKKVKVLYAKLGLTAEMWKALREELKWDAPFLPGAAFPQDPTLDQFFSAERVDAYQAVGRLLARRLLRSHGHYLPSPGSPALDTPPPMATG